MNTFTRITNWARTRLTRVSERKPNQAEAVTMADTTGATGATNMVSAARVAIKGLRDWQCEALEGIQVGSLVEVAVFERVERTDGAEEGDGVSDGEIDGDVASDEAEYGEASDEGNERSELDGDDESDGDVASDEADYGEASDEDDERSELDDGKIEADDSGTPPTLDSTRSLAKQRASGDITSEGAAQLDPEDSTSHHSADSNPRMSPDFSLDYQVTHLDDRVAGDAAGMELYEDDGLDGSAPMLSPTGADHFSEDASEYGNDEDDDLDGGAPMLSPTGADYLSEDASEDGNNEDEDGGESNEDDAENEGIDEEDDQDVQDDDEELMRQVSRELYVVLSVTTTQNGDTSTITDVHIRSLSYQNRGEEADYYTYRIFGNTISLEDSSATLQDGEEAHSVAEALAAEPDNEYAVVLNPGGDQLRRTLFGFVCPGRCNRGWLPDQVALAETVDEELETLKHYRPICPVCVGKNLMEEQMLLRSLLDAQHVVDIGMVVDYLGRLNPRRRQLGYSFVQFDEREWGYGFDDMLDGSGSEGGDADGAAQYEHWDEAMDPNANPKTRPASKHTVAALPRKTYADVAKKEDGAFCAICQEDVFEEESSVVELPCGHIYDEGCLEAWIKSYDNCPECRATVSGMVGQNNEVEAGEGDGDGQQGRDDREEDGLPSTAEAKTAVNGVGEHESMDGEDTIMSDATVD